MGLLETPIAGTEALEATARRADAFRTDTAYEPARTHTPASGRTTAAAVGAMDLIRLLLIDDKLIVREGLRTLLEQQPGMAVVAQASTLAEATAVSGGDPDVVIADVALPDARGIVLGARLRARFARSAILILTDTDDPIQVQELLASGVGGCLRKTSSAIDLVDGIRTVAQGLRLVSAHSVGPDANPNPAATATGVSTGTFATRGAVETLSANERQVLRYLVLGHTNAEIAELCRVSLRTIEARRARVLQKLGVRTRADLVRVARANAEILAELD